jgi:hypothetical protein
VLIAGRHRTVTIDEGTKGTGLSARMQTRSVVGGLPGRVTAGHRAVAGRAFPPGLEQRQPGWTLKES